MEPIIIDFSQVADEFNLDRKIVNDLIDFVIKKLTARVAYNWESLARQTLHATRWQYINSLKVGEAGPRTGYVKLIGVVPNMVEQGVSPFDMKEGFSHSKKAKMKVNGGWYLTIPFRWATPGALGESEVFSGVMPDEIYKIVKSKPQGKGLKISDIPPDLRINRTRAMVVSKSKTFEAYQHKSPIEAGIVRLPNINPTLNQGTYFSFRRVSDLSDPDAFIHTGITARNLSQKALTITNVPFEVQKSTDRFLHELGF